MLQKHITLFLLFIVALAILFFLAYLRTTYEGFQAAQAPATLASDPDAQTFFTFHGQVCDMWNQVIDAAMKSDQTTLTQGDYIQQLEAKQSPPATFVRCDTSLTAGTDLQTLASSIPPLQVYQATLTFLNQEIQKILDQTTAALQGKSQESFVALPPSFQAPFQCSQQTGTGLLQCTTQLQQVQPAAAGNSSPAGNSSSAASAAQQQIELLQQVEQQIQPIAAAIPSMQQQLQVAKAGLQKLNDYKQKAESGEIYSEVKMPAA
jgi:hypothetical protein